MRRLGNPSAPCHILMTSSLRTTILRFIFSLRFNYFLCKLSLHTSASCSSPNTCRDTIAFSSTAFSKVFFSWRPCLVVWQPHNLVNIFGTVAFILIQLDNRFFYLSYIYAHLMYMFFSSSFNHIILSIRSFWDDPARPLFFVGQRIPSQALWAFLTFSLKAFVVRQGRS